MSDLLSLVRAMHRECEIGTGTLSPYDWDAVIDGVTKLESKLAEAERDLEWLLANPHMNCQKRSDIVAARGLIRITLRDGARRSE